MRISRVIDIRRSNAPRSGRLLRRPAGRFAVLIGVLALALAACSDEATPEAPSGGNGDAPAATDPGGAAAAPGHPCELLSREEAAALAGNPVGEGKEFPSLCIWEPEDVSTQVQVSVAYIPFPPGIDPEESCQTGLLGLPNAQPATDVDLGNSAYWDLTSTALDNAATLIVCTDTATIQGQAVGPRDDAELQQIALAITTTVLGRV